jgi:hypothetical protein
VFNQEKALEKAKSATRTIPLRVSFSSLEEDAERLQTEGNSVYAGFERNDKMLSIFASIQAYVFFTDGSVRRGGSHCRIAHT